RRSLERTFPFEETGEPMERCGSIGLCGSSWLAASRYRRVEVESAVDLSLSAVSQKRAHALHELHGPSALQSREPNHRIRPLLGNPSIESRGPHDDANVVDNIAVVHLNDDGGLRRGGWGRV